MKLKESVLNLVVSAASLLNRRLAQPLELELGERARLFGDEGPLDSLSLVGLVADIEQAVEEELGVSIVIASAKALSRRHSPFATLGALVDYVVELIEAKQ
jgi:acyl carrier protein